MIDRRRFLQGSAAAGAALALPTLASCGNGGEDGSEGEAATATTSTTAPPRQVDGAFPHGVASGDPHPDSVVLWTRVTAGDRNAVELDWEVAADERFEEIVGSGTVTASAERDWTAKVVADGLVPGATYRYRFVDRDRPGGPAASAAGRTRTAPDGDVDELRFGVASCSNYGFGYFHAYRHLLEQELDAVIHLGDYIYEYAAEGYGETYGTARTLEPLHEIVTLDDYRERYAQYRSDPDLQELHQLHPMIHVWDDHEFADDPIPGGAVNHQPDQDGDWEARVTAALHAYDEWMPTRLDGNRIFRVLDYGGLVRVVGVDRQRRFLWPADEDEDRYLGREQSDWLDEQLADTTSRWTLLAQQTTFAPTGIDRRAGGWPRPDRDRVLAATAEAGSSLVVLTGDIHRFHAMDVVDDPDTYEPGGQAGCAAVEFSCGSITSPGSDWFGVGPQVRWNAGLQRGYAIVRFTPAEVRCDFWGFDDALVSAPELPEQRWLAGYTSEARTPALVEASAPS